MRNQCVRRLIAGLVISGLGLMAGSAAEAPKQLAVPERGFISSEPAETWEQGLISGNGDIGANVMSRPLDETVIFTHHRLFLPQGDPIMPPESGPRLFEIRRLIDQGLYRQADELVCKFSPQKGFLYPDPFVPAFDLRIRTEGGPDIADYMRCVDFQTGEATVHWADSRGVFERRLFVSRADGLAVMRMTGPGKGALSFSLALTPRQSEEKLGKKTVDASKEIFESHVTGITISASPSGITFRNGFTKAYPGSIHALEGVADVQVEGGTTRVDGDTLVVSGAEAVLVFVDIELLHDPDASKVGDMRKAMAALPKDYDALLKRHAVLHGGLFNRVRLDIGGGEDHRLTTEELFKKSTNDRLNRALIEKEFDAGRYNIISCTGELPPVLQGIWGGTYVPGWASDFTHNGNVPSAIAALMRGNTPELMLAYTTYIESLVPYLEINAKWIFGARGVVLPSRSTTHGLNNAFCPGFAGAYWVAGAPWAAYFFYDYYLYTGDRKFLAEHALPFMEKCVLFFTDYLYEGPDGTYVFSPTQSPENTPANSKSQASFNATMDVAAAKEVLLNTIAASRELGVNAERIPGWQRMLEKMPAYRISEGGYIQEWITPKLQDQLNHRHSSQLYALYDGMPEEIEKDPGLQAAFKKMIDIKLNKHWKNNASGFMSFGLVQLGQAATSLKDRDLAYQCLIPLVQRYWLNNLASMHNHKSLFNMDISGGMPAVILKMLAESYPGRIQLLPALPREWTSGTVEGLLCRGQIEIRRLHWDGKTIRVALKSRKEQEIVLNAPGEIMSLTVKPGGEASARTADDPQSRRLSLPMGQEVQVELMLK
jgi:hypothetical protein